MRKINIEITKAQLENFSVSFQEDDKGFDNPMVSASLALLTEGGKKVSQYSISTNSWSDNKFKLPIEMIPPIFKIAEQIEIVVTKHCRESQLALNSKN